MATIKINGREYPVPESFTMGELADIEEITGQGYDMSKRGVKGMLAIAYMAARKVDPSVTIDDIRALAVDQIGIVDDDTGGTEEVPTPGGEKNSDSAADSEPPFLVATQDETPEATGDPSSATPTLGRASDRETSPI